MTTGHAREARPSSVQRRVDLDDAPRTYHPHDRPPPPDRGQRPACRDPRAQFLYEYRKGKEHHYVADLSYTLVPQGERFLIAQKVIRLINGDDYLHSIGYIL